MVGFAMTSLKDRLEVAAPAAPAKPSTVPLPSPARPPCAIWVRVSEPPVVRPPTLSTRVLAAPAPPLAPLLP